jgi:hypothetical protein
LAQSDDTYEQPISSQGNATPQLAWNHTVRVATLLTVLISFIVGVIVALLFQNTTIGEKLSFSTIELTTFLFGIALSTASIVLAVAAISLGRQSEQTMIGRSDDSIRLQNEVFAKTVAALSHIQSSTGVTEKRIEDIISGRAGIISDKIADTIFSPQGLNPKSREEIEREVRESLLTELSDPKTSTTDPKDTKAGHERHKKDQRYKNFKDAVLLGVAAIPGVKTLKLGDGSFTGTGVALVDGLFQFNNQNLTVSTFGQETAWLSAERESAMLNSYVRSLASEIAKGRFNISFLVFDRDSDDEPDFDQVLNDLRLIATDSMVTKLLVVTGTKDHVIRIIEEKLNTYIDQNTVRTTRILRASMQCPGNSRASPSLNHRAKNEPPWLALAVAVF